MCVPLPTVATSRSFDALNQLTRIAAGGETYDFGYEPQGATAGRLNRAAGAYAARTSGVGSRNVAE